MQNENQEIRIILEELRRLVQGVRQATLNVEKQYGVSGAQLFILQQLLKDAPLSINELAERTLTHQSSVSVVVSKLEAKRLVKRVRSKQDARRREIEPTPKARRLVAKAPPPFQERLAAALAKLPAAKRRSLSGALATVNQAAGWHTQKPTLFFEQDTSRESRHSK